MGQQLINVGAAPNDGTGDVERAAWIKTNANFSDLYSGTNKSNSLRIGFAGDSIMVREQLDNPSSGIWQALMDRPRLINFDPKNAGAVATSGSSSGSTNPTDLINAANIANQNAYAADITFGLTGGNDNGGASTYAVMNNIKTFVTARWASQPSARFVWHVCTPQVRSSTQSYQNFQAMRSELHEMERRDARFIVADLSEYMIDPLTNFQPINIGATAGNNVLGGVVDTSVGQHPTSYLGWTTRGLYDKILDRLGVPEIGGFPIPTSGSIYDPTTFPGGNLIVGNSTGTTPLGTFSGSQTPAGTPANWQGTIAGTSTSKWDPVTPADMICTGTAGSSITVGGRSLLAQKIALNSGAATMTTTNTVGITRGAQKWANGAPSQVTARFFGYVYLENVVGISGITISITGTKGGVAGTAYTFVGTNTNGLADVWNAGAAVTRLCRIALPVDLAFDTATTYTLAAQASFPAGTVPSGNIYFAAFTLEPILNGF